MKKLVHNISVNVFEKDPEQIDESLMVFHRLLPLDFKKEKIEVQHEKVEGFYKKIIYILTLKTEKNRHNTLVLDSIFSHLSSMDIQRLASELPTRIDDNGFFYIRLDKQSLLKNEYKITEKGDCFHVKIKLVSFPACFEGYLKTATTLLSSYGYKDEEVT